MLSPYRVLDLTDEKGFLCGKILGDLGADVIKIEAPDGDRARHIGPFVHDENDPEKSLFWFAYNANKRGVTLDIETSDGQVIFKKLVKTADIVIESFRPGFMDQIGLGYTSLEKINPRVIMVSISPFGQTGPHRDFEAPDIVAWAMGGMMALSGDADRPPVRVSHHSQAYLHAGGEAAAGVMLSLYHREIKGVGQHVDVSIQESVIPVTYVLTSGWDMMKINQSRGELRAGITLRITQMWPCKDGLVFWRYWSGELARHFNQPLVEWMDEEGMADDFLKHFDWDEFDFRTTTQDIVDRLAEPTARFFLTHTKAELYEGALERRVLVYPVATTADILENKQLAARDFWVEMEHPGLDAAITYPGPFAKLSETPIEVRRPAPLIGEHNKEIYDEERGPIGSSNDRAIRPAGENLGKNPMERLLEGIKVADFSWSLVGPLTTKILSDFGAEVIKIESSLKPGLHRTTGPFKDSEIGLNRSGSFNQWNTGKLSFGLNLAHPKGIDLARRLVAWADVVVENFAGGVMKKMGLGYDDLRKVNPEIIMLSSCMMGQTGPYANHPGWGRFLAAMTGFNYIAGWPDREPADLGPYTDFIAPHFCIPTLLAALLYRKQTGTGQYIDVSQYETAIHFLAPLVLDNVVNHRVAGREGNRHPYAAPHGAYPCRGEDRWCAIAVFTEDAWESFRRVIGSPQWTEDPKFSTHGARKDNEVELDALVAEWTLGHTAEEVMDMMQAAGVAAGVLQTGEEIVEKDPHLRHRRFYQQLDHPDTGEYHAPRPSFLLSKVPCNLKRAPLLGEHTEHVLKNILRMPDGEIEKLVIDGVIE
jgi:crotonobetainyl-CoA:carnitine CoA-transferase CaiB-like acyl-CoA transferase